MVCKNYNKILESYFCYRTTLESSNILALYLLFSLTTSFKNMSFLLIHFRNKGPCLLAHVIEGGTY